MNDEWLDRFRGLAVQQQARSRQTRGALNDLKSDVEYLLEQVGKMQPVIEKYEEEFREGMAELDGMRTDPVVLVRNYGHSRYQKKTYHSSTRPCGWVRDPQRYERLLLGDAFARGAHPCNACGGIGRESYWAVHGGTEVAASSG